MLGQLVGRNEPIAVRKGEYVLLEEVGLNKGSLAFQELKCLVHVP